MIKKIGMLVIAASVFAGSVAPAHAITTSQRIAQLKYALCMNNPLVPDKTRCHL